MGVGQLPTPSYRGWMSERWPTNRFSCCHAGVQIHAWDNYYEDGTPNLEFVQPVVSYVVVDGERINLDLAAIPGLSPRQLSELANRTNSSAIMDVRAAVTTPFVQSSSSDTKSEIKEDKHSASSWLVKAFILAGVTVLLL